MRKFKLLDLFCGEGGASKGYADAGFEVVGIDFKLMKKYPFEFHVYDVLQIKPEWLQGYDAIHASPPCKVHTTLKAFSADHWVDLIPQTRELLQKSGKPYIIENTPNAPLINPVMLCGTAFGKNMLRHRIFESNIELVGLPCSHEEQARLSPGYLTTNHSVKPNEYGKRITPWITVAGRGMGMGPGEMEAMREVMAMPWASKDGIREAIPPYYTEFLGKQLYNYLLKREQGAI